MQVAALCYFWSSFSGASLDVCIRFESQIRGEGCGNKWFVAAAQVNAAFCGRANEVVPPQQFPPQ